MPESRSTSTTRKLLTGFLCAAFAATLYAQEPIEGLRQSDGDYAGIYLNDSFEVTDALEAARSLANTGRWDEAARLLQDASAQHGDKLVQIEPGYYVGARRHLLNEVASWLPPGVRAYRQLFEGKAEELVGTLPTPASIDDMLAIYERFFPAAVGAQLTDRIGQRAIEAGDFDLAAELFDRGLRRHPDRAERRADWLAFLAIAEALAGREPNIDEIADNATVRWMGEERPIGEVLKQIAAGFTAYTRTNGEDWPIVGGDTTRNRVAHSALDEPGLLWRFHFMDVDRGDDDPPGNVDSTAGHRSPESRVQPVLAEGLIVVQDFRRIIALNANTGSVVWRYQREPAGVDYADSTERPPSWDAVTIHNGRVYAALPGDSAPYYGYDTARSEAELVCLRLSDGALLWRTGETAKTERFSEAHFDSSPVVAGDRVYVVTRRRRSFGFEDCYLAGYDAHNGTLLFQTHIGSASTGTFSARQATMSAAAMVGDTVYVCTNLGSIAAVSAHTGAIRWIRLYERADDDTLGEEAWSGDAPADWSLDPIIAYGDRLIALPNDSVELLVLARSDGRRLLSVPRANIDGLASILGVRDEIVCGVGDEVACYDLVNEFTRWSTELPEEATPGGRGVWTENRLYVPARKALYAFKPLDGEMTALPWDPEGGPGNLLATPSGLIVAASDSVSYYVRKDEIWNTLRTKMAEAPDDPKPALDLAEIAFGGGETEVALEAMQDALQRTEDFLVPVEAGVRQRFFQNALSFAERLAARNSLTPESLEALHHLAELSAPDRDAHVRFRRRMADLFESMKQYDRAIELNQQILLDHSLRDLRIPFDAPITEAAGSRARDAIARIIEAQGRAPYARFEEMAERRLATARQSSDPSGLYEVIETFPNSKAAAPALLDYATAVGDAGRWLESARALAEAYHRYSDQLDGPDLLRRIADAYARAGRKVSAFRWLTRAAREHPGARIERNGRTMSLIEYRNQLVGDHDPVAPSRPTIRPPLAQQESQDYEGSVRLLAPWFEGLPDCDWSRYFVWHDGMIRSHDTRTGKRSWSESVPASENTRLLYATGKLAVFADHLRVFAVATSNGAALWSFGENADQADHPGGDWENTPMFRGVDLDGDRLVVARDDGQVSCIDVNDGNVIWSHPNRPVPAGRMRLGEEFVYYHVIRDGQALLCRLDAATGELRDALSTGDSNTVEDIQIALDGTVILATTQSIGAYNLDTRQRLWRRELTGRLRPQTLIVDVDAIFFSDDGRRLRKIGLRDGQPLWESQQLASRGDEGTTAELHEGTVIFSSPSTVAGVDAVDGFTLWIGTTASPPHFRHRQVTEHYVAAFDGADPLGNAGGRLYLYDHRNGSGLLPRGGMIELGGLSDLREMLVIDGAVLVQDAMTIHRWTAAE